MKRLSISIMLLALLVLACNTGGTVTSATMPASPPEPQNVPPGAAQQPCGDGVCDAAERAGPNLCPADCAAPEATPPTAEAAPAQAQLPPPTSAPGGPPEGQPAPEFNPFENMTAEQEACLKEAWGEEAFQAIITFQRPPQGSEPEAMAKCLDFGPGEPGGPPGQPGGAGATGVEGGHTAGLDQLYFATSSDGLTWSEGALLAEAASVPDVIRTSKGEIWAYWVDFSNFTGPNTEKIGVARSANDGATWEPLGDVNFTGLGDIVPVDPDVIELPDGRLRMYFYDITVRQGEYPIYSALSDDGLNFSLEDGRRFELENIYDPDVIQLPDGAYRMYLNNGGLIASASSPDGLTFTPDGGLRLENGGVPGSIVLPSGTVLLYACVNGISVFESRDGLTYTLLEESVIEPAAGMILCDPSVTAIPDGYLMVYKVNPGNRQQ